MRRPSVIIGLFTQHLTWKTHLTVLERSQVMPKGGSNMVRSLLHPEATLRTNGIKQVWNVALIYYES